MAIRTPKSAKKAVKAEATPVDTPTKMKTPKKLKTPTTPKTPKVVKPDIETPKKMEPKAEMSPKTPKALKTPKTPKTPKALKTAKTPKTPKALKTPKTPKTPKALKTPKAEEPVVETLKAEEPVVETPKAKKVVKKSKIHKAENVVKTPETKEVVKNGDEDLLELKIHYGHKNREQRILDRLGNKDLRQLKLGSRKTHLLNPKSVFMQFDDPITPQMARLIMKNFVEDAHTVVFGKGLRMHYEDEATAVDVVAKAKSLEFSGVHPMWGSHATVDLPQGKIHGRDADRDVPCNSFKRQKVERTEVAMEED